MTIRKKVENDFIRRGAEVVADKAIKNKETVDICLRIPKRLIQEIDKAKALGTSRSCWIREAIIERLNKE